MTSNLRIDGLLHEIPNVLSAEEADTLSNAIDNQHYGEWCPEGFDRRNRVQRYSGKDMEDHFGWVFDKVIIGTSDQEASTTLRRPLEVVITEHTPSSCRSIVNTFEQRRLCPCQTAAKPTVPVLRRTAHSHQQCNLLDSKTCLA